jgi:CheY-like chemotaxis protein
VINARDAMPDGGIIALSTRNVRIGAADSGPAAGVQPGDYVEIEVRDTGLGMTPAILAKACEPFFSYASVAMELESSSPNTPNGCGETVLIVEDDVAVRQSMVRGLDELGYVPIEAPDPLQALALLQSGIQFDLLIADVGLPHLSGPQLAEIARARHPELKVLFVTGYAEHLMDCSHQPGIQIMSKPFTLLKLATAVRRSVDLHTFRGRLLM